MVFADIKYDNCPKNIQARELITLFIYKGTKISVCMVENNKLLKY